MPPSYMSHSGSLLPGPLLVPPTAHQLRRSRAGQDSKRVKPSSNMGVKNLLMNGPCKTYASLALSGAGQGTHSSRMASGLVTGWFTLVRPTGLIQPMWPATSQIRARMGGENAQVTAPVCGGSQSFDNVGGRKFDRWNLGGQGR